MGSEPRIPRRAEPPRRRNDGDGQYGDGRLSADGRLCADGPLIVTGPVPRAHRRECILPQETVENRTPTDGIP